MHAVAIQEPIAEKGEEGMGYVEKKGIEGDLCRADLKQFFDGNVDAGEGLHGDAVDECGH